MNRAMASRATGVKCLAAATVFPTRPEPLHRTSGGVSAVHDTRMAVTNCDPIAAPTTLSRQECHQLPLDINPGLGTEGEVRLEESS